MSSPDPAPWEQPGYSDIVGAARTGDGVAVSFQNGETVTVSPGLLGVPGSEFALETDAEDPTRLRATWADGARDVDWSVIRAATDESFASELRARDTEESHRFGRRIRALRENQNLAQKEVAKLANMAAPQLSKLEKGESDMRLSTLRSLLRAMDASFEDISAPDAAEFSGAALGRLARGAKVHEAVVKLIAAHVAPAMVGATLGRAFGWSEAELNAGQLAVPALGVNVRFKASTPDPEKSPLLPMAHVVSAISAAGVNGPVGEVPADPVELRRDLLGDGHGTVTLEMLLGWAWAHGIVVVPLMGPGGFYAAVWNVEERPAIVVKDSRTLVAFWLFDIAHELGHIACGHLADGGIVDVTAPTDPNTEDQLEREATGYALEVLLPGHETLIAEVHERAKGDPRNKFKWVVKAIAEHANLSPSLLGVAAAHQLTDLARQQDRWGSAVALGEDDGSGREIAESYYRAHVPLAGMTDIDAGLIRSVVLRS